MDTIRPEQLKAIDVPANNEVPSYDSATEQFEWVEAGVGGGHTIQDEGTPLTSRTNLNFVGSGVAATDDAGNNATVITINGVADHAALSNLAYVNAAHTGFEPTVTKGNLTATTPVVIDQTRQVIGGAAVISIPKATTTISGYLSSEDWNIFNNKLDATLLSDLGDVNVAGVTDGQLLAYDGGAGEWIAVDPGDGVDAYVGTEIYRTIVGVGGVANIDITNIPAGYDELRLVIYGKSEEADSTDEILIAFNGDTTNSNYRRARLYGGESTGSDQQDNRQIGELGGAADTLCIGMIEATIPDYSSVAFHKVCRSKTGIRQQVNIYVMDYLLAWENLAAINQVTFTLASGSDFAEGTFVNLIAYKKQTIGGGVHITTRVVASPYNILATDEIVFVDTDSGGITVNLPAGNAGRHYKVINCGSGSHDVTLDPNGTEQIYGGGAGVALTLHDGEKADLHFETIEGWW